MTPENRSLVLKAFISLYLYSKINTSSINLDIKYSLVIHEKLMRKCLELNEKTLVKHVNVKNN